jgi:formylglycine-generating enzyme required for sulfatase activity
MVLVQGTLCVDRYELSILDAQGRQASPYYPILDKSYHPWLAARKADASRLEETAPPEATASQTPFPAIPAWQSQGLPGARAASRPGVVPNAYLSMYSAKSACERAAKRLCTLKEWQTACRGQDGTQFPYGASYKAGSCNVFREEHPGRVLFGQFTVGMLDPRMNLITANGKPLLRKTGASPSCRSTWGEDAIFDMTGNLDEWVDEPGGVFAGGFYARNTKKGCEQVITAHPAGYQDYSLGGRCCRDPAP